MQEETKSIKKTQTLHGLTGLGSALKSESYIAIKSHIEAQGWGHNLRLWWYPGTILLLEQFHSELPVLLSRARMSPS